jgi:protein SCO1/2
MNRRSFVKTGLAAAGAPLALPYTTAQTASFTSRGANYFTDAVVTTHEGRRARFYTDLLKGRRVIINFVFVGCTDVCDSVTQNLVAVQELLGDRVGREIFMYSISLMPDFDTPEVLKDYAERFAVKPGWSFLTGRPADIDVLRWRLGFADIDPERDANIFEHAAMLRIGEERLDRWAMAAALLAPESLVGTINRILPPPRAM